MSQFTLIFCVLAEAGCALFLVKKFGEAYSDYPRPLIGLLVTTGIFLGLFSIFYAFGVDCERSRLWQVWSVLYGPELESCFSRPRSRMALSPVIAGVYASPLTAASIALKRRFKHRS